MVYSDLSTYSEQLQKQNKSTQSGMLVPISDRLMSMILDFSIFSPLFALILSKPLQALHWRYTVAPNSSEFLILLFVIFCQYIFLSVLVQSSFWSIVGATPGQLFFQIRIVDVQTGRQPRLAKAALRSIFFLISIIFLGLPFLEVFSHSKRLAWFDRIADTAPVTLRNQGQRPPSNEEKKLVYATFFVFFMLGLFSASLTVKDLYHQAAIGTYEASDRVANDELCQDIPVESKFERIDFALAGFLSGDLDEDCLSKEIDFAFWKGTSLDRAWASVAQAKRFKNDQSLASLYLKQACRESVKSLPCELANKIISDGIMFEAVNSPVESKKNNISDLTSNSLSAKVLLVQKGIFELTNLQSNSAFKKNKQLEQQLEELEKLNIFNTFVQIQRIQIMQSLNQKEQASGARSVLSSILSTDKKINLYSALCDIELKQACQDQVYENCQNLRAELDRQPELEINRYSAKLLVQDHKCRNLPMSDLALLLSRAEITLEEANSLTDQKDNASPEKGIRIPASVEDSP